MKKALLLLSLLLALITRAGAQSSGIPDSLTAYPRLLSAMATHKTYVFTSRKEIRSDHEERIAGRLRQTFPDIAVISMRNREVTFSVRNDIKEETLREIFRLFGYTAYKITYPK